METTVYYSYSSFPNADSQKTHDTQPVSAVGNGSKRKQVKNACTNCQKACKKCDDTRPCPRCIKYGISDTCVNSVRKERKKGVKRGPYKRKQKQDAKEEVKSNSTYPLNQYAPFEHYSDTQTKEHYVLPIYSPYSVAATNSTENNQTTSFDQLLEDTQNNVDLDCPKEPDYSRITQLCSDALNKVK